ncbi:MAG: bestrophin family ion channel [Bacteroidota bacterium]
MILYNTKNWYTTIFRFAILLKRSYTQKAILRAQLMIIFYVSVVTVLNLEMTQIKFGINPIFFTLVGLILSLALVFRLNSAYNKWWEGRQQWGALVNDCRTLASTIHTLLPDDMEAERAWFGRQISNFPFALMGHLRDESALEEMTAADPESWAKIEAAVHKPHVLATQIFQRVQALVKTGVLSEIDKLMIKKQIEQFVNILGACERIKKTPIPFSHADFIKRLILVYGLSLPFGIMDTFGYATIPAAALISYALVGLEIISEEIEMPFGTDANDLPLRGMASTIQENVLTILEVPHTVYEAPKRIKWLMVQD